MTLRMAAHTLKRRRRPHLVCLSCALVTTGLENILIYLDDAVGLNEFLINHVATLAVFFARLRLHNLKLSPNILRIGAARVDFLGHVISQDGAHPYDDKVAALTHMPMHMDIKQLRSLLGGPSYYRKFLPNTAGRIRLIKAILMKSAKFIFTPAMDEVVNPLLAELASPQFLPSLIETQ